MFRCHSPDILTLLTFNHAYWPRPNTSCISHNATHWHFSIREQLNPVCVSDTQLEGHSYAGIMGCCERNSLTCSTRSGLHFSTPASSTRTTSALPCFTQGDSVCVLNCTCVSPLEYVCVASVGVCVCVCVSIYCLHMISSAHFCDVTMPGCVWVSCVSEHMCVQISHGVYF